MTAKDALRRAIQQLAAIPLGVPVGEERIWTHQARGAADGTQALALPVDTSRYAFIADPHGGETFFMLDMDPIDGGAPLAPTAGTLIYSLNFSLARNSGALAAW